MRLAFTIPGPIVPWQRATPQKRAGRSLNTEKHRHYARHARACAEAALVMERLLGRWPIDARYDLTIRMFFQDRVARDDDNVEKMLKDALKSVCWKDDSWRYFRRIEKTMALDRERPRIEMEIEVVHA
jgi:Holliday junction resolvase RusA-like endonuclease